VNILCSCVWNKWFWAHMRWVFGFACTIGYDRKAWFLLRDDADVPLPAFTGSRPAPYPNRGYRVAQMDLRKLQPLLEAVRGLLQRGLTSVEILHTVLNREVQPLHQWEVDVQMHLGPCCPDCPFSTELGITGINTWICAVPSSRVDQNFGPGPVPWGRGLTA
jgi:hypothetical protein